MRQVGIREFRAQLAEHISGGQPVAVTRHGQTVGVFVPGTATDIAFNDLGIEFARRPSDASVRRHGLLSVHRREIRTILRRYGARKVRLFGSVARGDATEVSDIDLLVDLAPDGGNELLRVSGLAEELSELLGVRVDVVTEHLLREPVAATALAEAVPV